MKNVYSNIYSLNKKTLIKTVNYLKQGNIVSLPTETVYGLAGNAYSRKAVKKIYTLKSRPKMNPLIVHYNDIKTEFASWLQCTGLGYRAQNGDAFRHFL